MALRTMGTLHIGISVYTTWLSINIEHLIAGSPSLTTYLGNILRARIFYLANYFKGSF